MVDDVLYRLLATRELLPVGPEIEPLCYIRVDLSNRRQSNCLDMTGLI